MKRLDAATAPLAALLEEARVLVLEGGLLVFPTETVYGIGCDPHRRAAVERLYASKERPAHKPLALHVATREEALEYVGGNAAAARAIERFLPGPLAVVVARPAFIDPLVTAGLPTLSLRVPAHALCARLLECCGPLAATSANRSGAPAFVGGAPPPEAFPEADLFIDDGAASFGVASTVVDFTTTPPTLVRPGALPRAVLEAELGPIAVSPPPPSNQPA